MGKTATLIRKSEEVQIARWVLALGQIDAAVVDGWDDIAWELRAHQARLDTPDDFTRERIANMLRMKRTAGAETIYRSSANENRLF